MLRKRQQLGAKKRSLLTEKRGANAIHGRLQPGSGCSKVHSKKADVKSGKFLMEVKYTDKKSYALTEKVLKKIQIEALKNNRRCVLRVELPYGIYNVIPEYEFIEYNNLLG